MWQRLINILLPPRCANCRLLTSHINTLCSTCWSKCSFVSTPYCLRCGWPLPYEGSYCIPCAHNTPLFTQGRSIFSYEGTIRSLILKLKHHDGTYIAPSLASFLDTFGGDIFNNIDAIIPIPLHPWRFVRRGFNQTTLVAHYLSKLRPIPINIKALKRHRYTVPQALLSGPLRRSNIKNAYRITAYGKRWVPHKRLLLLDDVWTTGSTLEECSKILINSGAKDVKALTIARVIPSF